MSRLQFLDPCPEHLYKYCSRKIYENHLKEGELRLGTLEYYREEYEKHGVEYGDHLEGNPTFLLRGPTQVAGQSVGEHGAVIVDEFVNAFVFCAAFEYSPDHHRIWFEREGCGYDMCVVFRASEFLEQLAEVIRDMRAQVAIMAAKPIYRSGVINLQKETPKQGDMFRYKHPRFEWEREYRLVCVHEKHLECPTEYVFNRSTEPLFARSCKLANCIESVLSYEG